MGKCATLRVLLDVGVQSALAETVFSHPLLQREQRAVRGRSSGAFMHFGSFQWTAGVHALCILLLRHALSLEGDVVPYGVISGAEGSPAVSLDHSLAKECSWLADIFGCDSKGGLLAHRIMRRSNPSRRRPGPVVISIVPSQLEKRDILFFSNNREVRDRQTLQAILGVLEGAWKHSSPGTSALDGSRGVAGTLFPEVHVPSGKSFHLLDSQGDRCFRGSIETRIFRTLADLDMYFTQLAGVIFERVPRDYTIWGLASHWWWPIVNPSREFENATCDGPFKKLRYLCSGGSAADNWVSDYYKAVGIYSRNHVGAERASDIWVCGDMVTETAIDGELRTRLDSWFKDSDTKRSIDTSDFLKNVYHQESRIELRVVHDDQYASYYAERLAQFY